MKEGDVVEQFDNLCEVQSDKASVTITSRYDGKIVKLHKLVDDIALVGKPLLDFDVEEEKDDESSSDEEEEKKAQSVATSLTETAGDAVSVIRSGKVLATPAVRRIAMENKVDLLKVKPSGKNRRVLKEDLLQYLKIIPEGTVKPHPTLIQKESAVKTTTQQETVVPLKGIAKAMVKSMTESLVSKTKAIFHTFLFIPTLSSPTENPSFRIQR